MLYVLYGLGIVNILEDMNVEKRDNCVFTPLQISILFIVKAILGFKNAYGVDEELEDDLFLQMVCTLDGDRTPSKSTLEEDIRRYKEEELQKAYQTIIQWMGILGFATGEIVACDSTKLYVDGDTYENSGEVYDYIKKETANGYKLFVIYDVVHRIPIYFEVHHRVMKTLHIRVSSTSQNLAIFVSTPKRRVRRMRASIYLTPVP